jgi:hypothetical protein
LFRSVGEPWQTNQYSQAKKVGRKAYMIPRELRPVKRSDGRYESLFFSISLKFKNAQLR